MAANPRQHPNLNVKALKFDGTNFAAFKVLQEPTMKRLDLWRILTGDEQLQVGATADQTAQFERRSLEADQILLSALFFDDTTTYVAPDEWNGALCVARS